MIFLRNSFLNCVLGIVKKRQDYVPLKGEYQSTN